MKTALLFLAALLPLAAQPNVYCKVSFGSSATMHDLYGGKASVIQARVNCLNGSAAPAQISGVLIDLSLPSVNTIPAADASALLTKTYRNQTGERLSRDLTTGLGAFGVLEASKAITLSAGPAGWVVAGIIAAIQYVVPSFTANEPPLNLANQCDTVSDIMIPASASFSCTMYIRKPAKTDPALPAAFTFAISATPAPAPPPPAPPVQLKKPKAEVAPPAQLVEPEVSQEVLQQRIEKIMAARDAAREAVYVSPWPTGAQN